MKERPVNVKLRVPAAMKRRLVAIAEERDVPVQRLVREQLAALTGVRDTVRPIRLPRDPATGGWSGNDLEDDDKRKAVP